MTNASVIAPSESFQLGTKAELEASEKQPLSPNDEKKPEEAGEVAVSVTVFANVEEKEIDQDATDTKP